MANQGRHRYPMENLGENRVRIGGRFFPNGSSALVAADNIGTTGWTVARTSTGLFTVTLDDVWQYFMDKSCSLSEATATDKIAKFGAESTSSKTIVIVCWDISDAAVADATADAGTFIDWGVTVKRGANSGKR